MIMEYLVFLITILLISVILEKKYIKNLFRNSKERIKILGIIFIIGIILDSVAIWRGYWFLSQEKLIGITFGILPLEEILFMAIIPYFVLVMYGILKKGY